MIMHAFRRSILNLFKSVTDKTPMYSVKIDNIDKRQIRHIAKMDYTDVDKQAT